MDEPRNVPATPDGASPQTSHFTDELNAVFSGKRCSLCGASRLSSGVCSLVPGPDGKGGCPDPLYDLRLEEARTRQLVDFPGVGVRSIDPGRPYVAGEVPQPLRDYVDGRSPFQPGRVEADDAEQDRLIIQLLFAAKRLVDGSYHTLSVAASAAYISCDRCEAWGSLAGRVHGGSAHKRGCAVGQVEEAIEALFALRQGRASRLIADLCATDESHPNEKEAATEEEGSPQRLGPVAGDPDGCRAGDGIRPPSPTSVVSELDQLARKLADEGAEAVLDSCTYGVDRDGFEWRLLDDDAAKTIADELLYLALRGVLVRHPKEPQLVRVDWLRAVREGGAQ